MAWSADLEARYRHLSSAALEAIALDQTDEYAPEAMEIAARLLEERGVSVEARRATMEAAAEAQWRANAEDSVARSAAEAEVLARGRALARCLSCRTESPSREQHVRAVQRGDLESVHLAVPLCRACSRRLRPWLPLPKSSPSVEYAAHFGFALIASLLMGMPILLWVGGNVGKMAFFPGFLLGIWIPNWIEQPAARRITLLHPDGPELVRKGFQFRLERQIRSRA